MGGQEFIPYRYGVKWAIQMRRNAIIISPYNKYVDLGIDGSAVIYNMADLNSNNSSNHNIYIIPNIIEWDTTEQKMLCHYINDHMVEFPISSSCNNNNGVKNESRKDNAMFICLIPSFKTRFKMIDWLLHKFWICCEEEEEATQHNNNNDTKGGKSMMGPLHVSPSLIQYIKDLMIHLRMHRLLVPGKGGGIHTGTLNDMIMLCGLIGSEIHGRDYVIPEDIKQGFKWYIPWHMIPLQPDQWQLDTSLLYGSDPRYVKQFHEIVSSVRTESGALEYLIVDDILRNVIPPI